MYNFSDVKMIALFKSVNYDVTQADVKKLVKKRKMIFYKKNLQIKSSLLFLMG